jgi:hypothetical protein
VTGRKENARHATQTDRIVELLRSRHEAWVPLPEILALGIAQYSARVHHGRHTLGLQIENRTEVIDGVRHSWFRLVEPVSAAQQLSLPTPCNPETRRVEKGAL